MSKTTAIINYDTIPNGDDWFNDNNGYWSGLEWITWLKELKKKYGDDDAKIRWLNAWRKEVGFFDHETALLHDYVFVDALLENGIDIRNPISGLITSTTGFIGHGGDAVENTGKAASNTTKALNSLAKTLVWLLPTILVVGTIGAAIYYNHKFKIIHFNKIVNK